ncbi:helix-turn-helix domain-containing protein [Acidilobus sp.]|uniref:helix-turn-helix domain-containing protein n=1 Tax=Acidilobus sp. TaxID=1872109 RepID=UPI003D07BD2D
MLLLPSYVHLLGKETRRKIIELMASGRGVRQLAEELGVTPAAISKYLKGETHPSDRVLEKAIESASPEEALEISRMVAAELLDGIDDYVNWSLERGVIDPRLSVKLSEIAAKVGLASLSSRRLPEQVDEKVNP